MFSIHICMCLAQCRSLCTASHPGFPTFPYSIAWHASASHDATRPPPMPAAARRAPPSAAAARPLPTSRARAADARDLDRRRHRGAGRPRHRPACAWTCWPASWGSRAAASTGTSATARTCCAACCRPGASGPPSSSRARLESAQRRPARAAARRDLAAVPRPRGQRAARIELAIRAWARRDAMARQAVDEADAARIAYIAQVFSALGFCDRRGARARLPALRLRGGRIADARARARPRSARSAAAFVERLLQQPLGA